MQKHDGLPGKLKGRARADNKGDTQLKGKQTTNTNVNEITQSKQRAGYICETTTKKKHIAQKKKHMH
eukprot:scaffold57590_cov34-Prasinocladus_malaysianus.AAC.2